MAWLNIHPVRVKVVNLPQTTTLLALGLLAGVLLFTPMVALIGASVPEAFREDVSANVQLMRDGLLLVLGYYFSKAVNAMQGDLAQRAMDKAPDLSPPHRDTSAGPDDGELPPGEKIT